MQSQYVSNRYSVLCQVIISEHANIEEESRLFEVLVRGGRLSKWKTRMNIGGKNKLAITVQGNREEMEGLLIGLFQKG